MAAPSGPNLPSLETIMNLVRALCNDAFAGATSTPGEGQILTDQVPNTSTNNPFVLNLLNSSIRELYRGLRITSTPALIQDNAIVTNLGVVAGPLGAGITDPAVQCYLDNTGWFTGVSYDNTKLLPTDMMFPIRLWERYSGTNDTFTEITQLTNGLPPRDQVGVFQQWEWRYERLNFVGATTPRDIRIRYWAVFPTFFTASLNYSTTFVPIIDCEEFVAYATAAKATLALGNPTVAAAFEEKANGPNGAMYQLRNQRVRRMQQANYKRKDFSDYDSTNALDNFGI